MLNKTLFNFFVLCFLFSLSSCDTNYSGSVNLSGICVDTCDGSPLVNHKVTFERLYESFHTYTDSQGYFHLKGSYNFESKKPVEAGTILFRDTVNSKNCCFGFSLNSDDLVLHGDTFYQYRATQSIIRINLNSSLTTSAFDTLYLNRSSYRTFEGTYPPMHRADLPVYSIDYHEKYAGPFTDGQILDTVNTMLGTHVGFQYQAATNIRHYNPDKDLESYQLYYPFTPGQSNIGCDLYQELEVNLD